MQRVTAKPKSIATSSRGLTERAALKPVGAPRQSSVMDKLAAFQAPKSTVTHNKKSVAPLKPSTKLIDKTKKGPSVAQPSKPHRAATAKKEGPSVAQPSKPHRAATAKTSSTSKTAKPLAAAQKSKSVVIPSSGHVFQGGASKRTKSLSQKQLQVDVPEIVLLHASMSKVRDKSLQPQIEALVDRIHKAHGFPQQRRLSLRDNDLVTTLHRAMYNDPSLTEIHVDADVRFTHISKTLLFDFAEGIRTNLYLKVLRMTRVGLDNGFLSALSTSIESNFTLEKAILSNNSFTSDALVEFCQAMGENESVREVDLSGQLSPILTTGDEAVIESLRTNHRVERFAVDVKSKATRGAIEEITERNKRAPKTMHYDSKLLHHLDKEAFRAEELYKHKQLESKTLNVDNQDDWGYLLELSDTANKYRLAETEATEAEKKAVEQEDDLLGRRASVEKMLGTKTNLTSDGSFLNNEFIDSYLVEDLECGSLTFAFQTQYKVFKHFPIGDRKRKFISEKFVDTLVHHPRAKDITHINMANCGCGDEWLVHLCERSLADPKLLGRLHLLNMETNYLSTAGVIALSKCISSRDTWKYLQAVKLENQRHLISSRAELELAKALCINRSVIRFSLRVRNLWERGQINKFVSRNMDFLRQARLKRAMQDGTHVRARNKIEELFDRVSANDPSLAAVEVVANPLFLALPKNEVLKAARSFATNSHVTSVRMTMLQLDDEFACEFAKSLETNRSIEKIVLDSNAIGSDGVASIVSSLAKNATVVELHLRHQSKTLGTVEEEALTTHMGDNMTIAKLGIDLRSMRAQTDLDRRLTRNRERARQARHSERARQPPSLLGPSKPKGKMQEFFHKIAENDASITKVEITGDKLFLAMRPSDKLLAAASFATNTTVTSVKLTMLHLDDDFAMALASATRHNATIEKLILDSNMFSGDGVRALVSSLAENPSITDFQIRHQKKPLASSDEEDLVGLLGDNQTLVKLGVDLRSSFAQREIDVKLNKNRDIQRQARRASQQL